MRKKRTLRSNSYRVVLGLLALCIFVKGSGTFSQARTQNNTTQASAAAQKQAQATVNNFLQTWLVKKDIPKAVQFFHPKAFENKLLLTDDWLGSEWGTKGKKGTRAVKKVVAKVLRDVTRMAGSSTLEKILSIERWKDVKTPQDVHYPKSFQFIGSIKKDRYLLVQAQDLSEIAQEQLDWTYITAKYPSSNYVGCVINIRPEGRKDSFEAIMFFLWAKTKNRWQIILFGVYGV